MQDLVRSSVPAVGQIRNFLTALPVAILIFVPPAPHGVEGLQHYLPLHSFLETIAICASTAIFAFCLNAQHFRGSNDIRWLAWIFLAVALLDFSHMISYPGMPDFVTPASAEKAINFWLAARCFAAIGLFVVAARLLPAGISSARHVMPMALIGLVAVIHVVFLFFPDVMPRSFVPGTGLTPLKVRFEYAPMLLYAVSGVLFLFRRPAPVSTRGGLRMRPLSWR